MRLIHLSLGSVAACVAGLVLLLIVGVQSLDRLRDARAEAEALVTLQQRVNEFSAASDALLLHPPGETLWRAFAREGEALGADLRALDEGDARTRRAAQHVELIIDALRAAGVDPTRAPAVPSLPGEGAGPATGIPLRARVIMSQIAGHGIALDSALDSALRERRGAIATEVGWIIVGLGAAAVLFGVVCVTAFMLVYARVQGPANALARAVRRVHGGEPKVRAPVRGNDEFTDLASAFNRMLDTQQEAEAALRDHEHALEASRDEIAGALETRQALINALPAHIALLDGEGTVVDTNEQWRHYGRLNGYDGADLGIGRNYLAICRQAPGECRADAERAAAGLEAVLAGEQASFTLEYACHGPDRPAWYRLMASRLPGSDAEGHAAGAVVMHVDITERKLAERELNHRAYHDPVTGLLNRQGLIEAIDRQIRDHGWSGRGMVVMLDVEGQRNINAAHGHDAGDRLLARIGQRLQERLGGSGHVARTGGDEFVIFLPPQPGRTPEDQRALLATTFEAPFDLDGVGVEASARFGFTLFGDHRRAPDVLLHEAELALFEIAAGDPRRWGAYTGDLDQLARERIDITRELRRALQEQQFELHFQPKVDLASGRMEACEALLRWNHPERGLQPPGRFIPVAEQSQLIGPIGDWVLFEACRQLRAWRDAGLDMVRVAVNVSVVQFRLGRLTETVQEAIETYGVDASGLTLEITESVFEEQSQLLREQLRALHRLGVRLSLDDFGTGYSSLLYLQQYPFDEIKIDKGFVFRVLDDAYSRKIVTTVLGIAGAIGADTVAEGVESAAVAEALVAMGCRVGQGFHYSMPLAEEDFRWLLETGTDLPVVRGERRARR